MVLTLVKWPPLGEGYWTTPTYSAQYALTEPLGSFAHEVPFWLVLDYLWRKIEAGGPGRFTISGFEVEL